ncbi:MAG: hypothetical protein U0Q12_14645 [Vicinamibacterales bacterium]
MFSRRVVLGQLITAAAFPVYASQTASQDAIVKEIIRLDDELASTSDKATWSL